MADKKYLKSRISYSLLLLAVLFIALMIGAVIYQNTVLQDWKNKYEDTRDELELVKQQLANVSAILNSTQRDLALYDQLYSKQKAELKYSKDIAIYEISHVNSEDRCLEPFIENFGNYPEIRINASAEFSKGWPVLHLFLDGRHFNSLEIDSSNSTFYSSRVTLRANVHDFDILYVNPEEGRRVTIHDVYMNDIPINTTFWDEGAGPNAFNCYSPAQVSELTVPGSLRFRISR